MNEAKLMKNGTDLITITEMGLYGIKESDMGELESVPIKKYRICNVGCDDETNGDFMLTKTEYLYLKKIFDELNKNSSYGCMPKIYIEELREGSEKQ